MTEEAAGRRRFWQRAEQTARPAGAPPAGSAFVDLFGTSAPTPAAAPPARQPEPDPAPEPAPLAAPLRVPARRFTAPRDLEVTPDPPGRALAIGSCFLENLLGSLSEEDTPTPTDFILVNGIEDFPASPPRGIGAYDYQVVQLPLRFVINDDMFIYLAHDDEAAHAAAFDHACANLALQLESKLAWNKKYGILTFVFNFMLPQHNLMGRFFPRYSLINPSFFVQRLNQELERLLGRYTRAYVFDLDGLAASFGRRYVQDDTFTAFNHNASFSEYQTWENRIEDKGFLGDHYDAAPGEFFRHAILEELRAMMRTVRQQDAVKLVIMDLDDTLWNGVSGDAADVGPHMAEGWPLGVVEALAYLRKRGIVLAICSKNDEARIKSIWHSIFHDRLKLEDFGAIRINWQPKVENMREIMAGMNVLPRNVLFVDDNPVERAAMQAAFPDMRVIGDNVFHTRRILLLAAELQTVTVTAESAQRTQMIQAQFERESARAAVSPGDFARAQNITVRMVAIASPIHPRFTRALELLNKTNQFNTTGRRWKMEECCTFFGNDGTLHVFDVEDRFTPYGLVGVVLVQDGCIVQWVMSCRVIGMRVEQAVMAALAAGLRASGVAIIRARLVKTATNLPCHSLFENAGFVEAGEEWRLAGGKVPEAPPYVTLTG